MKVFFQYIIAAFLFSLAFWGITYTSDWINYEYYFDKDMTMKSDVASFFIFNFLKEYDFDYRVAFRVHIALMSLLYPLVFVRMRQNPILYTILFIIFVYVPVANQIRYYVAFPIAILAIISYSEHKFFQAIIWSIVGFAFHATIIVLFGVIGFYYFYVVRKRRFYRNKFYYFGGIVLAFLVLPLLSLLPKEFVDDYSKYSDTENISSFIGGLYTMMPKFIALFLIFLAHNKICRNNPDVIYQNERMYFLLWTFSVATAFLIPLGFSIQIFVHRFVTPMLVFQVMYFAYAGRNQLVRKKIHTNISIIVILSITLLWQTYLSYWLHITNSPIDTELLLILSSYQL